MLKAGAAPWQGWLCALFHWWSLILVCRAWEVERVGLWLDFLMIVAGHCTDINIAIPDVQIQKNVDIIKSLTVIDKICGSERSNQSMKAIMRIIVLP
jgi:hypothetical protein